MGFSAAVPLQQQSQPTFSPAQQTSQKVQPAFIAAGFGGFSPQPLPSFQPSSLSSTPQDSIAAFQNTVTPAFQGLQAPQAAQPFGTPALNSPFQSQPAQQPAAIPAPMQPLQMGTY